MLTRCFTLLSFYSFGDPTFSHHMAFPVSSFLNSLENLGKTPFYNEKLCAACSEMEKEKKSHISCYVKDTLGGASEERREARGIGVRVT